MTGRSIITHYAIDAPSRTKSVNDERFVFAPCWDRKQDTIRVRVTADQKDAITAAFTATTGT